MQEDSITIEEQEQSCSDEKQTDSITTNHFSEIIEDQKLLSTLDSLGHNTMTALQKKGIEAVLGKENVFIHSERQTSTTLIYGIALASQKESRRSLIVTSAAEEADEIAKVLCGLELKAAVLEDEKQVPSDGILVGTASSCAAALSQEQVEAANFDMLVCDGLEFPADNQLEDLPTEQIESIFEMVGESAKVVWISQTLPLALTSLANKYIKTPNYIEINSEQDQASNIEHVYYEVEGDLLAKPHALCDLIELENRPPTAIFCNNPSDADLVDVILKRRGISTKKLIGHIPPRTVVNYFEQAKDGQVTALIVTDIAARALEVEDLDLIINHSIHSDPEVYIHRLGNPTGKSSLKKVISIIGPTDLGNFHYLKKLVEFEFTKKDLPSDEDMLGIKLNNLHKEALNQNLEENEAIKKLYTTLMEHADKDKIIALLLHNTFDVIPKLQEASAEKPGRDNNKRNKRDYQSRKHGRSRDRDDGDYGEDNRDKRDSYRDRRSSSGRKRNDNRHERREREEYLPPKKDTRIYIGHGLKDGFSEALFTDILSKYCETTDCVPERLSIRDLYSFVDFPEENAEDILEKLQQAKLAEDVEFIAYKATSITAPREVAPKKEEEEEEQAEEATSIEEVVEPETEEAETDTEEKTDVD